MNNDDWDLFKKTVNPLKNRRKFHLQTKIKPKATVEKRKNEDLELIDIVVTRDWGNLEKNILKKIQKGKIKVSAHKFTESAKSAIEAAGGEAINI